MSGRHKRETYKAYHGRYKFLDVADRNFCYYCGIYATTIDHAPPLDVIYQLPDEKFNCLLVPCCNECNILLGRKYLKTLKERKSYIKKSLKKRYKNYLSMPSWSEDELSELGDSLRQHIVSGISMHELIKRRIRY